MKILQKAAAAVTAAIITAAAMPLLPACAEESEETADCPYRVIYEANGHTLREYRAGQGENYYPFSVVYLGGITEQQHSQYMAAVRQDKPFSVDIIFTADIGTLYLYDTCEMKYGKPADTFGGYIDSNYSVQICASLEPFAKDGEMLYAFTIYDEDIDEELEADVVKAKNIIARSESCIVDVRSGDDFADSFGHVGEYTAPVAKEMTADISGMTVSKPSDAVYKGKAVKPAVTVKDLGATLKKDIDYTVTYRNNKKIGTGQAVITGIGRYFGTVTRSFRILPRSSALSANVTANGIRLRWGNAGDADAYVISVSTDDGETFKNLKAVSAKKSSCTVKLPKGAEYVFRIRSYKTVDGKKYYSAWSKPAGTGLVL